LIEKALETERDRYLDLGCHEHGPEFRFDYRNALRYRLSKIGVPDPPEKES
jgi:hypothetical protein